MIKIRKVLISDDIDACCPRILEENGVEVTLKTKLSKESLVTELQKHDALLVRSATKVMKEVLDKVDSLKLIGRAGTGVDNIDVDEATRKGIIVMNTPAGNSRSAAELTCAMIMSLARHIPQACSSMKSSKWDRKSFMGREVFGKTLAIIGLGRIGREVATRMQAFGMKTVGFDPLVSKEESAKFDVAWMNLEEIWPIADYITLHVPLIPATANLVNKDVLEKCKQGVCFINCARGGIINEDHLVKALDSGKCGGAGFDVFKEEPPTNRSLIDHPKVISTPHLGASTIEAQVRVAEEIAEQIVALNNGTAVLGALNAASIGALLDESKVPWVKAVEDLSLVIRAINPDADACKIVLKIPKACGDLKASMAAASVVGYLRDHTSTKLNLINAQMFAKSAGLELTTEVWDKATVSVAVLKKDGSEACRSSGGPSALGTIIDSIGKCSFPAGLLCRNTVLLSNSTDFTKGGLSNNIQAKYVAVTAAENGAGSAAMFRTLDEDEKQNLPEGCFMIKFD